MFDRKTLAQIRSFIERMGIAGRDLWELPISLLNFPDGTHYRFEIAGVENASSMSHSLMRPQKETSLFIAL